MKCYELPQTIVRWQRPPRIILREGDNKHPGRVPAEMLLSTDVTPLPEKRNIHLAILKTNAPETPLLCYKISGRLLKAIALNN